jgi:hypothetical protein
MFKKTGSDYLNIWVEKCTLPGATEPWTEAVMLVEGEIGMDMSKLPARVPVLGTFRK